MLTEQGILLPLINFALGTLGEMLIIPCNKGKFAKS